MMVALALAWGACLAAPNVLKDAANTIYEQNAAIAQKMEEEAWKLAIQPNKVHQPNFAKYTSAMTGNVRLTVLPG